MPAVTYQQIQARAALEIRRRAERAKNEKGYRAARSNLISFTKHTMRDYMADQAHYEMASHLDDVLDGHIDRLMIFAPPQHGKSELVSVRFPAYWLANSPNDLIILTSYAADLAHEKSKFVRDAIDTNEFRQLYPKVLLDARSRAIHNWRLKARKGGMLAAGVGGPVTGRGGPLGIIDDPFENWEQAQSERYRNRAWDWYRLTFRTRIHEGGAIILVMTRWHEDDLAGKLLAQDNKNRWVVLRLPAIAETQKERDDGNMRLGLPTGEADPIYRKPGEPLSPSLYSIEELHDLQEETGAYGFSAEYQGLPLPAKGLIFQYDWFDIVDAAPDDPDAEVTYWDKAGTAGGGSRTAGVNMARKGTEYYIKRVIKGQWSAGTREKRIKEFAESQATLEWYEDGEGYAIVDPGPTIWMEQEPGSGGKDSVRSSASNLAGFRVKVDRVTGSKEVRADPLSVAAENGHVHLVRGGWNGEFLRELTGFPFGSFKDQVDAAAGAYSKIAQHKRRKAKQHQG
jgi:hypothetical protein